MDFLENTLSLNHGGDWAKVIIGGQKVGIGTVDPQGALDVHVGPGENGWNRFVVTTTKAWDGHNDYATLGAGGSAGVMLLNAHVPWFEGGKRASIRYGRIGGHWQGAFWDAGVREDGAFSFSLNGGTEHQLLLNQDGNVGIGTTTPQAKLDVAGDIKGNSLTLGDWTIVADGNHLRFKHKGNGVARFSIDHDRLRLYQYAKGATPYFYWNYYGQSGVYNGVDPRD